jgi:putative membrane protein
VISSVATSVALAAAETHPVWGFGWWFLFIPLFWFLVIGLLFAIFGRRRRYWAHGYGYGPGPWGGPWGAAGSAGAESVLSERYARGDIDEKEYRARLEVLRASNQPPVPPKG